MDAVALAEAFPLMRGGGLFLAVIGVGVVAGGVAPVSWRIPALIAGAVLGVVAMAVTGITRWAFDGIGHPAWWQWAVLGVAVLVEGYLVSLVAQRYDFGTREFWLAMLFVVGVHFLLLTFSHGPVCGLLGVLCMANALVVARVPAMSVGLAWSVDGTLKIVAGVVMIAITLA